jgi:predicted metal-dependent RNase
MKYPSTKLQEIARDIGLFFLKQNNEDYAKIEGIICNLSITDIQETPDGKIQISTSRPGLLIGRKRQNIDGWIISIPW